MPSQAPPGEDVERGHRFHQDSQVAQVCPRYDRRELDRLVLAASNASTV
jgi:hypothetical protein